MKAGLNLFSIRNYLKTEEDFLDAARQLKEMGYSFLQYSGGEFDPDRIRRVSEAVALPVVLTHVPMDRILNDTDALMRDHESFGCRNIGLGAMPAEARLERDTARATVDALEKAAAYMESHGFHFYYHHHHFEFYPCEGERVFDYMVEYAPHINFTLDTYWLQYGGVSIIDTVDRLQGRIGCVHLKDYRIDSVIKNEKRVLEPNFAPVGDGTLDFAKIIPHARRAGAKYFFVEQDNAATLPDTMGQVERSIRYIQKYL